MASLSPKTSKPNPEMARTLKFVHAPDRLIDHAGLVFDGRIARPPLDIPLVDALNFGAIRAGEVDKLRPLELVVILPEAVLPGADGLFEKRVGTLPAVHRDFHPRDIS
jgi:hypothetical protein